jgi:hypothetical protein
MLATGPSLKGEGASSGPIEGWHHLFGEPMQLLLELFGRQALGPMNHEILKPRVSRFDRSDPIDDVRRRSTEPSFLLHPVAERGDAGGGSRSAPGPPKLVGIAREPKRREPLIALVMRWLEAADRFPFAVGV